MRTSQIGVGLTILISTLLAAHTNGVLAGDDAGDDAGDSTASLPAADETIKDADGNIYTAVKIGAQTWMVENLRTTRYLSGEEIPRMEDSTWSYTAAGAYCHPALGLCVETEGYGLLYDFHAVSDCGGLCPDGWHVPSADEWRDLIAFLGGVEVAGARMRSTGAAVWNIEVDGTTNESGFSALPAGGRGRFGGAGEVGNYATWWSSTLEDSMFAWHWGLHPDKHNIRANPGHVQSGFSVRCIKNRKPPDYRSKANESIQPGTN